MQQEQGRQRWTAERIARLGFLAGQGRTAKQIARDPLIRSTPNNVFRQSSRFGIYLSEAPQGELRLRLPLATRAAFDQAASVAQLRTDAFLRRMLIGLAADPVRLEAAAGDSQEGMNRR